MEPATPEPPTPAGSISLGTTSLILGAVAVPALFLFALGMFIGVAAVVTGVMALARRDRPRGDAPRAGAGVTLGVVALAGAVILIARPDS